MEVTIAPHLAKALEVMSRDMAVEPHALVNQAVFAWLRINGYVVAGAVNDVPSPDEHLSGPVPTISVKPPKSAKAAAAIAAAPPETPVETPIELPTRPTEQPSLGEQATPQRTALIQAHAPAQQGTAVMEAFEPTVSSVRPDARVIARIDEIDSALASLTRPRPAWARPPEDESEDENEDASEREPDEQSAAAPDDDDGIGYEDTRLPGEGEHTNPHVPETADPEAAPERTVFLTQNAVALFIEREGEAPIRVEVDRFIIGRGPQCDLIIDSPRVSREHVALTRKGVTFLLEDLGSSNGTWFNGDRISVRELEDGDVITLGNEEVRFGIREG